MKFSLYFLGIYIPTNESLVIRLPTFYNLQERKIQEVPSL